MMNGQAMLKQFKKFSDYRKPFLKFLWLYIIFCSTLTGISDRFGSEAHSFEILYVEHVFIYSP